MTSPSPDDDLRAIDTEEGAAPGESFDVLLQLTFPVVLILAFIALLLRHELAVIDQTPAGQIRHQMEQLIVELQKQVLTKAAEDAIAEEERTARLQDYAASTPSPDGIVAGQLHERYRTLSTSLYRRFNRPDRDALPDLRHRALDRYAVLAAQYPSLAGRPVTDANRAFVDTMLAGNVDRLIHQIVAIQQDMAVAWIRSDAATAATRDKSRNFWRWFTESRNEADEATSKERFNTVKIEYLRDTMIRLQAPLLDKALQGEG